MIKITELTDHKKIIELVDEFGGETSGLEKVALAWIALFNDKEVGISGVIEVNNNYWILDPLAVKEDYRNKGIEERLIKIAVNYAKQNDIKMLYNMTKYIKAHENCGFRKISIDEIPKDVHNLIVCFSCDKWKKDCFPEPMKLDLKVFNKNKMR